MRPSSRIIKIVNNHSSAVLAVLLFIGFAVITLRSIGAYPVIAGDELVYLQAALGDKQSRESIPIAVFHAVFSTVKSCGDHSYICGKLINIILLFLTVLLIFRIGRYFSVPKIWLFLIALTLMLNQGSVYVSFFTPEIAIAVIFFLIVSLLLRESADRVRLASFILVGGLLGMAVHVKPSALLFVPAIAAYLILHLRKLDALVSILPNFLVLFLTFLTLRTLLLIINGNNELSQLFGGVYDRILSSRELNIDLIYVIKGFWDVFLYHLTWIIIKLGFPLYVIYSHLKLKNIEQNTENLAQITLLFALTLITLVAIFTVYVHLALGGGDTLNRLHTRYYFFLAPLILLTATVCIRSGHELLTTSRDSRRPPILDIIFVAVLAIFYYHFLNVVSVIQRNLADNPDFHGLVWLYVSEGYHRMLFYTLLALSFFSTSVAILGRVKLGFSLYLIFMAVYTLCAYAIQSQDLRQMGIRAGNWGAYQSCGAVFKEINSINNGTLSQRRLFLVGPNPAEGYHFDIIAGRRSSYHSFDETTDIVDQRMVGGDVLVITGKVPRPAAGTLETLFSSGACSVQVRR